MAKTSIKAVTFDLWLTLIWDSREIEEYRRLRRLINFHRFVNKLSSESLEKRRTITFSEVRLAIEEQRLKVKQLYEQGFDVHPNDRGKMLFDFLKIKFPEKEAQSVYEKAGDVLSNSGYASKTPILNPEAKPTLAALKENFPGIKIGLISNAARSSKTYGRMMKKYGISEYFDDLVISCEVGYLKPRREIFEAALNRLSVSPREALHIGDLFEADVVGATSAGMNAVLYTGLWNKYSQYMNPGEHIPQNFNSGNGLLVAEIASLQDLPSLLKGMKQD